MPLFIAGTLIIVGLVSAALFIVMVPVVVAMLAYDVVDSRKRAAAEKTADLAPSFDARTAPSVGAVRRMPLA